MNEELAVRGNRLECVPLLHLEGSRSREGNLHLRMRPSMLLWCAYVGRLGIV